MKSHGYDPHIHYDGPVYDCSLLFSKKYQEEIHFIISLNLFNFLKTCLLVVLHHHSTLIQVCSNSGFKSFPSSFLLIEQWIPSVLPQSSTTENI